MEGGNLPLTIRDQQNCIKGKVGEVRQGGVVNTSVMRTS